MAHLTSDHDVRSLILASDGENIITGLCLRLSHQERPVLPFLQQLLGGLAGLFGDLR
jgi:hypothetical protein